MITTNTEYPAKRTMPQMILRIVAGSELTGTNVGSSDRDELGITVESPRDILGLDCFTQWMSKLSPDQRMGEDELDLTIYGLRKFVTMALKGNPNILQMFFAEGDAVIERDLWGAELQSTREWYISQSALRSFLGYMTSQRQRLLGERGQKDVNRPELVAKYGYDTKYASHLIRLGLQGLELAQTGRMSLPMRPGDRDMVMSVRRGEMPLRTVVTLGEALESKLAISIEASRLPERPDRERANQWLTGFYPRYWESV
jgi:predicted nucleotidyltransferase